METIIYMKFLENNKHKRYLDENSFWIKELNRNPNNYNLFIETMKIQYKDRTSDKIEETLKTVDMVNTFFNVFE